MTERELLIMRLRNKLAIIAAATCGFAALPAQAAVQVTAFEFSPPSLGGGIALQSAGISEYGVTGRFLSTIQDLGTLNIVQQYTFCIDLLNGYATYSPFADIAMTSFFSNPGQQSALAGLLTHANGVIDGAGSLSARSLAAAAFGLAIWEVVYDSNAAYDVTSGNFSVFGDFAAAGVLANTYLANVQNGTWAGNVANIRVLSSISTAGASQNQIYYTPNGGVPEPSTWAMMLAGFAMVGAAMRRRVQPVLRFART